MSVLTSEAVVLRTWPVHEADLIVCFFTRNYGNRGDKGLPFAGLAEFRHQKGEFSPGAFGWN